MLNYCRASNISPKIIGEKLMDGVEIFASRELRLRVSNTAAYLIDTAEYGMNHRTNEEVEGIVRSISSDVDRFSKTGASMLRRISLDVYMDTTLGLTRFSVPVNASTTSRQKIIIQLQEAFTISIMAFLNEINVCGSCGNYQYRNRYFNAHCDPLLVR
jgi:hypothetical protein